MTEWIIHTDGNAKSFFKDGWAVRVRTVGRWDDRIEVTSPFRKWTVEAACDAVWVSGDFPIPWAVLQAIVEAKAEVPEETPSWGVKR